MFDFADLRTNVRSGVLKIEDEDRTRQKAQDLKIRQRGKSEKEVTKKKRRYLIPSRPEDLRRVRSPSVFEYQRQCLLSASGPEEDFGYKILSHVCRAAFNR